ncbi:hypothetical protein Leryth_023937 [Lithospermum erythrorhizon]|nr:hypothetical protein Leryth_023937 [Lithospermum erythrorhizon]
MSRFRIVLGLLTFVTIGMIIVSSSGALVQLAIIRRMEDSYGSELSIRRRLDTQHEGISIRAYDEEASSLRLGYVKPEIISWAPRIILFHNFLSSERVPFELIAMGWASVSTVLGPLFPVITGHISQECDYLRTLAKPRLQISTVVDAATGKGIKSDVRTSSGMFLNPDERKYPIIQAIEKRISVYSQIPVENGERIQVLRYDKNQYYRPHNDYFSDAFNIKHGGQRVATMLMYLSDNVEGGETYFPQAGSAECSCGGKLVKGVCLKPNEGDAVLFWSMGLDGQSDPKSIHGGCQVLSGEKWSATKWMRQKTAH